MLVLTRKPGEQIVVQGNIRITVVSVGPGRVKIGIEAPPDVQIDRQEIHEKKSHEDAVVILDPVKDATSVNDDTKPMTPVQPVVLHNRIAAKLPSVSTSTPTTRPSYKRKPR